MVEVVENGKKRRVSVQAAVIRRLVNEAVGRGNMAAMKAAVRASRVCRSDGGRPYPTS
jgi:hypothetical protein